MTPEIEITVLRALRDEVLRLAQKEYPYRPQSIGIGSIEWSRLEELARKATS